MRPEAQVRVCETYTSYDFETLGSRPDGAGTEGFTTTGGDPALRRAGSVSPRGSAVEEGKWGLETGGQGRGG